jgi:hypothetical protein
VNSPMTQPDITFVSLGSRCETAWQIRQFYGQPQAYPFDWLVTPLDTLPLMIEEDFEAIADPRYLQVTQYGNGAGWSVENTRYKILLHHEFKRAPDGSIVPDWLAGLGDVVSKFAYLRRRWADLMNGSGRVCFIRRLGCFDMPSEQPVATERAHYLRLFAAVSRRAPRILPTYMFCDCPNVPIADNVLDAAIGYATPVDWPEAEDRWKGRTVGYRDVFAKILTPALNGTSTRRRFG